MIKLEVNSQKRFMKDSFIIRTDEPMRVSVDVSEKGHVIVFGYQGTEDDLDQDPVVLYDSENDTNYKMEYNQE